MQPVGRMTEEGKNLLAAEAAPAVRAAMQQLKQDHQHQQWVSTARCRSLEWGTPQPQQGWNR